MPRTTTHHTSLLLQVVTLGFLVEILLLPHCSHALPANSSALQQLPARCCRDQAAALLGAKRSFNFTYDNGFMPATTTLSSWREGTDCCRWEGVGCDNVTGRVTTLDLPERNIQISGFHLALSRLTSLQYINLAFNCFNNSQLLVSGLESLTRLTYLNLSSSNVWPTDRQIPVNILRLSNLITLDLGYNFALEFHPSTIVANLSKLKELHLHHAVITDTPQFFKALANHFPLLQVLSITRSDLLGPLPDLFTPSNFPVLRELTLTKNNFEPGTFPVGITGLENLMILYLEMTNLVGAIPNSIGNLTSLTELHLGWNRFFGGLPWALSNLTNLIVLDCRYSGLTGQIPWLTSLTRLEIVWLANNNLTGPVPLNGRLQPYLRKVDLSNNALSGTVPASLFTQPTLQILYLQMNRLSGDIKEFQNTSTTLNDVDLSSNQLTGAIPTSFSSLIALDSLRLEYNNFTGTLDLNLFLRLRNLRRIAVSHNPLLSASGDSNETHASSSSNSSITTLDLAYCNLTRLPHALRYLPKLGYLDLSCNKIQGEIPTWIWRNMDSLNLSHNLFTRVGQPLHHFNIRSIDLSFNMLHGVVPFLFDVHDLDYSNNKFSSIPPSIFLRQFKIAYSLNLANNELSGPIPYSECHKHDSLQILDLSGNNLSGSVPPYLLKGCNNLVVLNLRGNHLDGTWPDETDKSCQLQVIDLHGNQIQGRLPRSLARCQHLIALDIGGNRFAGSFPLWLGQLPLQLLVLRYNNFHGRVNIPPFVKNKSTAGYFRYVQIIDLAGNGFSGELAPNFFKSFKSMVGDLDKFEDADPSSTVFAQPGTSLYQVAIDVAMKQQYMRVAKVSTYLVVIDLSSNRFSGFIPRSIGNLTLLHVVNLSRNAFSGKIPCELSQLAWMESLDLSWNHLTGKIPQELTTLTTLEWLNVSYNDLSGRIPSGNQFSTFTSSSFQGGNRGLYGCPLLVKCNLTFVKTTPSLSSLPTMPEGSSFDDIMFWLFVGAGFGVGFALTIVLQVVCSGRRKKIALQH